LVEIKIGIKNPAMYILSDNGGGEKNQRMIGLTGYTGNWLG
jgi:hypothetical protein